MDHPTPSPPQEMPAAPNQQPAPGSHPPSTPPQAVQQPKSGIGGCLLFPLLILLAQPVLFVFELLKGTARSSRIYVPYLIYDLLLVGAVLFLLVLFMQKKKVLPALFNAYLLSFTLLAGLLTAFFSRRAEARVTGREPMASFFALLIQCLLLVPYFTHSERVRRTFVNDFGSGSAPGEIIKLFAAPASLLYRWLTRRKLRTVILLTVAYMILVFLFFWLADSIVLNFFL